jgi:biopolymer transport protein ExbD
MRKHTEEYLSGNLTAMIDVVFQLIIFFVATVNLQDTVNDDRVRLALAPSGKPVVTKDPREVNIDVDRNGQIRIARFPYSHREVAAILKKLVADNRNNQIPVIIRGDMAARHDAVQKVMDACAAAGIWKIKFAALKERGS